MSDFEEARRSLYGNISVLARGLRVVVPFISSEVIRPNEAESVYGFDISTCQFQRLSVFTTLRLASHRSATFGLGACFLISVTT